MKNFLFGLATYCMLLAQNVFAAVPLKSLSQEEFLEFLKQETTVVIDVRTPREYAAGHVPGAINLPHREIVSGKLTFENFKDKNIVLYCHTGVRAGIVNQYLDKNPSFSIEQVFHLKGDFRAWQARGRVIVKP